jgi:hypothetical protein
VDARAGPRARGPARAADDVPTVMSRRERARLDARAPVVDARENDGRANGFHARTDGRVVA